MIKCYRPIPFFARVVVKDKGGRHTMPKVLRQKVIKQDLGEAWHTFCVRIIKKNEMARYKVGFSGPHTLRTVSAEFICLPHLHGGPEEIRSSGLSSIQ